ncbi:hypothetical protein [Dolichospermum sp. UHCC 0259]|uniref:hypothetical protein n=1 Tax=Dolichospermum sp. UHCC 0259 TaxID=2590010 RepID=UPI0014477DF8|nr:hypothetical protein [Dolichospermum sp. UHCC 0259]MTJ47117.1 hypothetical protein [Dolichospermum sp. UHCC 0259]
MNKWQYFSQLNRFKQVLLNIFIESAILTVFWGVKLCNFLYRTIFVWIVSSVYIQDGVKSNEKKLVRSHYLTTKIDESLTLNSKTKVLDLAIKTKKK